ELERAEADFGGAAGVELQRDDALTRGDRVVAVDARLPVDPRLHARAVRDDAVAVPVALLHVLPAAVRFEQAAAVLLVEPAPPARTDVGLQAAHVAARQHVAAELHAAVARVADEPDLELELEVAQQQVAAR